MYMVPVNPVAMVNMSIGTCSRCAPSLRRLREMMMLTTTIMTNVVRIIGSNTQSQRNWPSEPSHWNTIVYPIMMTAQSEQRMERSLSGVDMGASPFSLAVSISQRWRDVDTGAARSYDGRNPSSGPCGTSDGIPGGGCHDRLSLLTVGRDAAPVRLRRGRHSGRAVG